MSLFIEEELEGFSGAGVWIPGLTPKLLWPERIRLSPLMPTFTPACCVAGFVKQNLDHGFLLKSSSSSPKLLRVGVTPGQEASCCSLGCLAYTLVTAMSPTCSHSPQARSVFAQGTSASVPRSPFFWLTPVHVSNQFLHQFIRKKLLWSIFSVWFA